MIEPLTGWKNLAEPHKGKMKAALETISKQAKLSDDIFEIVSKSLG